MAAGLPPGAVLVFLSHRWLGPGRPDDEQGTKTKQVAGGLVAVCREVVGGRCRERSYLSICVVHAWSGIMIV